MFGKLFGPHGKKNQENVATSGDLIIPATFNLTRTNLKNLPKQDVIDPESDPISSNIVPALYDVKPTTSRALIRRDEIIVPEEPIQIEYKPEDLTNQKLGLRQTPYSKVKRPGQ
jgi:hypothetical protein